MIGWRRVRGADVSFYGGFRVRLLLCKSAIVALVFAVVFGFIAILPWGAGLVALLHLMGRRPSVGRCWRGQLRGSPSGRSSWLSTGTTPTRLRKIALSSASLNS